MYAINDFHFMALFMDEAKFSKWELKWKEEAEREGHCDRPFFGETMQ